MKRSVYNRMIRLEDALKPTRVPRILYWVKDSRNPRPPPDGWDDPDAQRIVFRVVHEIVEPEQEEERDA